MREITKQERLVIVNASLRGRRERADIVIENGVITSIESSEPSTVRDTEAVTIDAKGSLVTESYGNAHLHLDKVFTLASLGEHALSDYQGEGMGNALRAIESAAEVKRSQDAEEMLSLARRALAMAAFYGTTHVRALADVDTKAGTRGVEVLNTLRDEFAGIVDVQVVAFPQDGIAREPGTFELIERSMELGADVVGGIPWIEHTEETRVEHVKLMFDIAETHDADISMLLDDTGDQSLRTLETMAREAIRRGWEGRALAHHCRAMHLYPNPYFGELLDLLLEADISIVSDPHTGPLHARVVELIDAGVNVVLGQDDISDAYYAFGRNNMAEVAFLGCHLLWMMTLDGQNKLFDAVTTNAMKSMNINSHTLEVGNNGNIIIHEGKDVTEVLRFHGTPRAVISHGELVDLPAMRELGGVLSS